MAGGGTAAPEPVGTGRELAGAQHRLPVRHLPAQPDRMRVGRLRPRDPGSVDDPAAADSGADARGRRRVLHHRSTAGQVALAAPLDRGFNRLAWLFPYSVAALAAGGLGYGAYRMAKRPPAPRHRRRSKRLATRSWPTSWMTSSAILTDQEAARRRRRAGAACRSWMLGRGWLLVVVLAYGLAIERMRFGAAAGHAGAGRDDAGVHGGRAVARDRSAGARRRRGRRTRPFTAAASCASSSARSSWC